MKIDKISNELIITEKINNCYLLYTSKEYYLFKPENNSYTSVKIDISENPNDVESSFTYNQDNNKISNNSEIDGSLKIMMVHLEFLGLNNKEQINTIHKMFYELAEIKYYSESDDTNETFDRIKRFNEITDEKLITLIETISLEIERNKKESIINELYNAFKYKEGIKKAQRDLGNYLNTKYGIILRINSHELYKLDAINKGYNSTSIDEIITLLPEIFGEKNLFKTTDIESAVDHISDRLTPEYNIVKFSNGLYSMKQHQLIEPNKPVFTLIESPYAYNPDAKPKNIIDYLESTFKRESKEKTENKIKGVLQVIGYLFTSGNIYNTLIFLVGIGGSGKGTLATIIAEIFKGNTTQLDFSKIEKDSHATSILIGKHLNIVRETRTEIVEDNTTYKILSGNDSIDVNPKNKPPYELPAEEVPKSLMNANNLPNFRNPDVSILQRFVLIEFKNIFRNTSDDVRNLAELITNSSDDMEWLIYNSLQEFKKMVESNEDFILRLNEKETLKLLHKHSKPLNYLIRKLILKHDAEAYETDIEIMNDNDTVNSNGATKFVTPYIVADELKELIVYLSEKEGVQIPLDKTGKVNGKKILNTIRDEFDLFDYHPTDSSKKYTTINKRINGKQQRIYPELIKTEEYDILLKEMKK